MNYDTGIKVTQKTKKKFTVSIAINDNTVITKSMTKAEIEQLYVELEEILKKAD